MVQAAYLREMRNQLRSQLNDKNAAASTCSGGADGEKDGEKDGVVALRKETARMSKEMLRLKRRSTANERLYGKARTEKARARQEVRKLTMQLAAAVKEKEGQERKLAEKDEELRELRDRLRSTTAA